MTRPIAALVLAVSLTLPSLAAAQSSGVVPAPEWDALFDRTEGWTGADGIFSIPLDGDERAGAFARTDTLFLFSDTFIGTVAPDDQREPGTTMVNNTLAFRPASRPDASPLDFYYGHTKTGAPRSVFVPTVPEASPGEFYWLKDGIALKGTVYVFAERLRTDPVETVVREGVSLIEMQVGQGKTGIKSKQRDVPLALPATETRGPISYGAGILANTATAGVPGPDGYIYVYGTREDPYNKSALVARVPEAKFADVSAWRFFNGRGWVRDINAAAPITDRVSNELSVSPLPDGRYVMVFQLDSIRRTVAARIGETPWGPFGEPITLYRCDVKGRLDMFCYNAKAHPHLSRRGELLISYNVNTINFAYNVRYADIYRPRFIRVSLETLMREDD